jgi:hypothetical protein
MRPYTSLRFLSVCVTLLLAPSADLLAAPAQHEDTPFIAHASRTSQPSIWVHVMNPDGIYNGNGFFPFGATCLAHFPTAAAVVGVVDGRTLYRLAGEPGAFGTQCPRNTLLLMPADEWHTLQEEGKRWQHERASLQDTIRALVAPPKEPR